MTPRKRKYIGKIINKQGEQIISELLSKVIKEEVVLSKAIPELETRFDEYGHGREHDLGIFGETTSGKSVFIGAEAKVDDTFNIPIINTYLEAKSEQLSGISTNKPERIESLIKRNFKIVDPGIFCSLTLRTIHNLHLKVFV